MIVLDASALIELLLHTEAGDRIADRIADPDLQLHVPHLVDVEVAQAMRRFVRAGDITASVAGSALETLRQLDLRRHSHDSLLNRIWDLRDNFTAYDATDVALAEALDATLLTCDARLSRAPGLEKSRVELMSP